jgi:hypothetical protein
MMKMPQDKLRTDWVDTQNIVRFQERLNAATEDGRYKILAQLLTDEFRKFKKEPLL